MLERLTEYYRQQGISAMDFHCLCKDKCKSVCKDFVETKEAFVGSGYERGEFPRLLFISADPLIWKELGERQPQERTALAVRRRYEKDYSQCDITGGSHWYETHDFACKLFKAITDRREGWAARADNSLSLYQTNKYFAHTNSAKCKDMSQGSKQGPDTLFTNCQQFIKGEVEALAPDIIVTQGVKARTAIECFHNVLDPIRHPEHGKYKIYTIKVKDMRVLRVSTYHPAAWRRGYYKKEKQEAFSWYIEELAELVSNKNSRTDCLNLAAVSS